MSTIKMSVYTLMGLISKDIPLATITVRDKKSKTDRVFEYAVISLNLAEITLTGGVEAETKLTKAFLTTMRAPLSRANEWVTDWSREFRINAEFIAVRERHTDGTIGQSWAFRVADLTKPQRRKLITSSELTNSQKGPIIPRFTMEVGAGRNHEEALERRIVMRPAGLYFSSKAAKGKGKSL